MNGTMAFLKFDWLNDALLKFFDFMHTGVAGVIKNPNISYGLTIILVTVIIRLLLFPLNYKQIKSTVKMNAIQPKIKDIQAKYKNNPQKLQEETMKLYKQEGVNPLGGCLPLLLQWPILIALYFVFMNLNKLNPDIAAVSFLGLNLMGTATLSNPGTWILPLLSGATTYFSTKLMQPKATDGAQANPQASQATTMNIAMTGLITWMSFRFSTALVLYWVTNNLFQLGQTLVMNKANQKEA